jgi:hypothetical protein
MNLKDLSATALRERRRQLVRDAPSIEQVMRGTLHYLSVSQAGSWPHRDYVRNADFVRVAQFISNLHKLRNALDEICAINTELMRRHEDLG